MSLTRESAVTMTPRQRWAFLLLASAQAALVLDSSVVAMALPEIAVGLSFDPPDVVWIYNAFLVPYGGAVLLGGRLGDLVGHRRIFVSGLVAFTAALLLATFAWSPGALLAARAVQGIAAACVTPAVLALLLRVFPDGDEDAKNLRNRALGALGVLMAVGSSSGFFLGGALTYVWGWRSIFAVLVPLTLAGLLLSRSLLPADTRTTSSGLMPFVDGAVLTIAFGLLVYLVVNLSPDTLLSAGTLWPAGLLLVFAAVFLARERWGRDLLVPPRFLVDRQIAGANAVCVLVNMASGPIIVLITLYLQDSLGMTPLVGGVMILPLLVMIGVSSRFVDRFVRRLGLRTTGVLGLAVWAVGLLWLSQIDRGSYLLQVLPAQILIGGGSGLILTVFTVAGTTGAAETESGLAGGLLSTGQNLGQATGLSVLLGIATAIAAGSTEGREQALASGYRVAVLVALVPLAIAAALTLWSTPRGQGGRAADR